MRQRLVHLGLNWLVFGLCYPLANASAQHAQVRRSLAIGLDAAIPFIPWTIVPYATSGLILTLVFFLVRTPEQLRVASRRLLATTVAGALCFVLFPARFSLARALPLDAPFAPLYRWLAFVDQPYNQFPSLHVAYCVVFWSVLQPLWRGPGRLALGAWLLAVAASTVFTWQHHLADVAGGLLLGCAVVAAIRPGRTARHAVAFHYAVATGVVLVVAVALRSWLAAWVALSLALVAVAYRRRDANFFRKRAGRHPLSAWLLFWPYLAGYRLTWALVLLRERGRPALAQDASGLWIGRRLTGAEARTLPAGCWTIDLSTELTESPLLRNDRYLHLPLLDLHAPRPSQLRRVLREVAARRAAGDAVYVHCAMGYSRSRLISRLHSRIQTRKHTACRSRSTS